MGTLLGTVIVAIDLSMRSAWVFLLEISINCLSARSWCGPGHPNRSKSCASDNPGGEWSAQSRDQTDKSCSISREARGQQERSPENQHNALEQFCLRCFASIQLVLNALQGCDTLQAQQPDTGNCSQDNEADGGQGAY